MRADRLRHQDPHRRRPMLEHQARAIVTARSRCSVASTSASNDGIVESYHDPDEWSTELVLMMWNDAEGGTPPTPQEEDNVRPHDVEYFGLCAEISHSNTSAVQWCIDCHCAARWVVPWALCSWYREPYEYAKLVMRRVYVDSMHNYNLLRVTSVDSYMTRRGPPWFKKLSDAVPSDRHGK